MKQGRSHLGSRTRSLRSLVADSIGTDIGEKVHSALASRLGRALRFDLLVCRMGHATLEGTRLMNRMSNEPILDTRLPIGWSMAIRILRSHRTGLGNHSWIDSRSPNGHQTIGTGRDRCSREEGYSTIFRDWANRLHGLCQNTIGL